MSKKVLDYKKEHKDLYMPKDKPMLIVIPSINFIMCDGTGDPNDNSDFQQAIGLLYGLSFTIKMSKMKGNQAEGYFEYVVPPLEGLWWIDEGGFSLEVRDNWKWTLMIRQPEFVNEDVFKWACSELIKKKREMPIEKVRFEPSPPGAEPANAANLFESGYNAISGSSIVLMARYFNGAVDVFAIWCALLGLGGHAIMSPARIGYLSSPMNAVPQPSNTKNISSLTR